jgi:hypothetical protein
VYLQNLQETRLKLKLRYLNSPEPIYHGMFKAFFDDCWQLFSDGAYHSWPLICIAKISMWHPDFMSFFFISTTTNLYYACMIWERHSKAEFRVWLSWKSLSSQVFVSHARVNGTYAQRLHLFCVRRVLRVEIGSRKLRSTPWIYIRPVLGAEFEYRFTARCRVSCQLRLIRKGLMTSLYYQKCALSRSSSD